MFTTVPPGTEGGGGRWHHMEFRKYTLDQISLVCSSDLYWGGPGR